MQAQSGATLALRDAQHSTGNLRATRQMTHASPRLLARLAGVFYALEGVTSVFGQFIVTGRLVAPSNATATAANLLAHQPLYWLGFTSALLAVVCHITYTALFYEVLKPVNRSLALVAAFVSLVGCAIQTVSALFQAVPMLILTGASRLSAFAPAQTREQALLFLNLNTQVFNVYLVFFGFWCVLIGYLIFRSTFLPRIIGVLMMIAGLGYLVLLSPPLANALYPYFLAPAVPAEPSLMIWLLVVGLNAQRWKEQAGQHIS